MRTTGPLILAVVAGLIALSEFYIPHQGYHAVFETLRDFAQILAAMAFILGALNLLQVNYPKIVRRESDWQFKVVMLVAAVLMGVAGIRWHDFGEERPAGQFSISTTPEGATHRTSIQINTHHPEALVKIDGSDPVRAWHDGTPEDVWSPPGSRRLGIPVEPGEHRIAVFMPVEGYDSYEATVSLAAGQTATVDTELPMWWGAAASGEGRVFTWLYDHVFFPCNATMFALLAFFIASAAFRAFRARNIESALLLGAAILVMLGLVPIGRAISDVFPELADWIVEIPNNAGRRAIMMGAALGAIATGLRVILGLERSHMGAD